MLKLVGLVVLVEGLDMFRLRDVATGENLSPGILSFGKGILVCCMSKGQVLKGWDSI